MLKKWLCVNCKRVVIAFSEDMANRNDESFCEVRKPIKKHCDCSFKEIPTFDQSTMHGEAGFSVEGTVLDSTDTIHDHEKICTEKAADARELKSYLDARKNA
jgi:hypothetical protein